MEKQIILLDLNYTLVENSRELPYPNCDFKKERYRKWLVNLIKDCYVILITARMRRWMMPTMANISQKTAWHPQEKYFNDGRTAPVFKEHVLENSILPRWTADQLLAIESNVKTTAMYHKHGVKTVKIYPGDQWIKLPAGKLEPTVKPTARKKIP